VVCERFFQDCGKNSSKQELKEGGADAARGRHSPLQKWADVRPGLLQQALRSHHTDLLPSLRDRRPNDREPTNPLRRRAEFSGGERARPIGDYRRRENPVEMPVRHKHIWPIKRAKYPPLTGTLYCDGDESLASRKYPALLLKLATLDQILTLKTC